MAEIAPGIYGTVSFIEVKPGQWRAYGYPEKSFIPMEEGIYRLKTSSAGFHGYQGKLQPYAPIAQYIGEGRPTPMHRWWVTDETVTAPEIGYETAPGEQLLVDIEYTLEGEKIATRTVALSVGETFDQSSYWSALNRMEDYRGQYADEYEVEAADITYAEAKWRSLQYHRIGE